MYDFYGIHKGGEKNTKAHFMAVFVIITIQSGKRERTLEQQQEQRGKKGLAYYYYLLL